MYTCIYMYVESHAPTCNYDNVCMTCAPVLCKLPMLACLSKHDLYWCYNQAEMHGLQWWITIIHALYSCSSHLPIYMYVFVHCGTNTSPPPPPPPHTHTHTYVLTLSHLTLMFMCTKWVVSPHFLTHSHT